MATCYGAFPRTVKFAPRSKQIYVDSPDGDAKKRIVVRGITHDLKRMFAPHYSHEKAVYGAGQAMESKNFRLRAKNSTHGIRVGKKVDREISRVIGKLILLKIPLTQFLHCDLYSPVAGHRWLSPQKLPVLQRLLKSLDTRTKWLLTTIDSLGIEPLGAQLPVACLQKRRGTTIDVPGRRRDATKRLVTINVKTHTKVHYDKHTGHRLAGPFVHCVQPPGGMKVALPVMDSQRNQDALQVLAENLLFRSQLKLTAEQVESFVLRVDADGVEVIPIPEWASSQAAYVWSRL